ncbi:cytochrome P450 3A8-like [Amblyomma americanum]
MTTSVILLEVFLFAAVVALAAFVTWAARRRHKQGLLKRYGIPGPPPSLFFGNYMELKKDRLKVMETWAQKYGKVYGFYEGEVAKVVIGDMAAIKECFVKRAHEFVDRPPMVTDIEVVVNSLIGLKGDEWKTVRNLLNPSFTTAKMKLMLDVIHQCSDATVQILSERVPARGGAEVNISKLCQGLSMDVITKCALGWQSGCQQNTDDLLVGTIRNILWNSGNIINDVCILIPCFGRIISAIFPFLSYGKLFTCIHESVQRVVELRKKQAPGVADIVQLMVEAQKNANEASGTENRTATWLPNGAMSKASFIRDTHIVSNCFLFMAAGYETTASTLAFVLYELAKHPDEQRRLHQEIMSAIPNKEAITYEDLQELKRLDAVIRECLRLYPPLVLVTARICPKDTHLANGHVIPRGSHIVLPTWNVLHDPHLWSDPYNFDPNRFSESLDRDHLAASGVAFGLGPRECIGKRFALLELKAVLSKLLKKFKFSVCGETQTKMKFKVPLMNMFPQREIVLHVEAREPGRG